MSTTVSWVKKEVTTKKSSPRSSKTSGTNLSPWYPLKRNTSDHGKSDDVIWHRDTSATPYSDRALHNIASSRSSRVHTTASEP